MNRASMVAMAAKKPRRAPRVRTEAVYPSETPEARKARGRPAVMLSLPQDVVDHLQKYRKKTGESMSETVAHAVRAYLGIPE